MFSVPHLRAALAVASFAALLSCSKDPSLTPPKRQPGVANGDATLPVGDLGGSEDTSHYMSYEQIVATNPQGLVVKNPEAAGNAAWLKEHPEFQPGSPPDGPAPESTQDDIYEDPQISPNVNPSSVMLDINTWRNLGIQNRLDYRLRNKFKVLSLVFERAFMESATGFVLWNDSPDRQYSWRNELFTPDPRVRPNRVSPDGLGPTATRSMRNVLVPGTLVQKSAFYEVKSGGTILHLAHSASNPLQLYGMLTALRYDPRINQANRLNNSTLFLITPYGVPVARDLITQAAIENVNLIQITPTYYPRTGQISFENARVLYRIPDGWMRFFGANMTAFTMLNFRRPVTPNWREYSPALYDED